MTITEWKGKYIIYNDKGYVVIITRDKRVAYRHARKYYGSNHSFMTLEDPTTQQSAFVSLVTAMLSASFALWLGKEAKTDRGGYYAPDTNRSNN